MDINLCFVDVCNFSFEPLVNCVQHINPLTNDKLPIGEIISWRVICVHGSVQQSVVILDHVILKIFNGDQVLSDYFQTHLAIDFETTWSLLHESSSNISPI